MRPMTQLMTRAEPSSKVATRAGLAFLIVFAALAVLPAIGIV